MKYQNYLNNVLKLLQDYRDSVNGVKQFTTATRQSTTES